MPLSCTREVGIHSPVSVTLVRTTFRASRRSFSLEDTRMLWWNTTSASTLKMGSTAPAESRLIIMSRLFT